MANNSFQCLDVGFPAWLPLIRAGEAAGGGSRWSESAEIQTSRVCFGLLGPLFSSLSLGNRQKALGYILIDLQYLPGHSARLVFIYSHISTGVVALSGKFELGRVKDPACTFSAEVLLSCPASQSCKTNYSPCLFFPLNREKELLFVRRSETWGATMTLHVKSYCLFCLCLTTNNCLSSQYWLSLKCNIYKK